MKNRTDKMEDFRPSLFHPYYFMRKGIFNSIKTHANKLNGKILDFGCGSKPYESLFSYTEYIGIDYMSEGHSHENEKIDVFYDGKTIPLPENHFDSVLSSEVFEHVFNLPEILVEINRVMKTGGVLLATCPFVWKEHEVPNDYARYTVFALEDILVKNNFKKIQIDKAGNFVEVIFQLIILFWYDKLNNKVKNIFLINSLFTFFFVFIPNVTGVFFSKILSKNKHLYLSNIIIFQKN